MTGIRISGDRESAAKIGALIAAIPGITVTRISGPRDNKTDPGVRIYMNVELAGKDNGT